MTHEDLQELRRQGHRVRVWRSVPEDKISCPECGRPSEYAQRRFDKNVRQITLFCVNCGCKREVALEERYRVMQQKKAEVTE